MMTQDDLNQGLVETLRTLMEVVRGQRDRIVELESRIAHLEGKKTKPADPWLGDVNLRRDRPVGNCNDTVQ
jgi:hypothetical protein